MSKELATINDSSYCFGNIQNFEDAQRMATSLCMSTLVPKDYHGRDKISNCVIALEISQRLKASPLMIMQNLYIVHGKPGWSSQFIIAAINICGKFRPLRFDLTGAEGTDDWGCVAWTVEKKFELPDNVKTLAEAIATGIPVLKSPRITIGIAKKEGWHGKAGSKWQTMPELMLHYRSASFFGKLYAPEILMGMQTAEEVEDVGIKDVTPRDNSDIVEAFMGSDDKQPEDKKPNAMDELLARKPQPKEAVKQEAAIVVDAETGEVTNAAPDPAKDAMERICAEYEAASTIEAVNAIRKANFEHIKHMSNDYSRICEAKFTERRAAISGK